MLERTIERAMYGSRWLLAPIYVGLSIAVALLGVKFFQEVIHVIPHLLTTSEVDLILLTLSLIDIALVGGLLVMVMLSGYENFVSELNIGDDTEKLGWLGKIDSGGLKNKVAAAIVAISSIHLLKVFMDLENVNPDNIKWYIIIHLTFVSSAFAMGILERLMRKPATDA